MPSRLDRLFTLLDSGGSPVTRNAAAKQLGEIVKLHPDDVNSLISRLHSYIISKSWETRVSAGQAITAIVNNIEAWDPPPVPKEEMTHCTKEEAGPFSLGSFSIKRVLEKGSYLMSSSEKQFDSNEAQGGDSQQRAKSQKDIVNEKLGFNKNFGLQLDLISDSDFAETSCPTPVTRKDSVHKIIRKEMSDAGLGLSSREMNREKRKKRALNRQTSSAEFKTQEEPEAKKFKSECNSDEETDALTIIEDGCIKDVRLWPFNDLCEQLTTDLFDSSWETRHGAATGLREIIKIHGRCAGKNSSQTESQMEQSNQAWLEDKAVRFVCVLALDRFGDFIADQVVAPVRETCAQALGAVAQFLKEETVWQIVSFLVEMLKWSDWATRHGGLLGLKYLLAVRQDLTTKMLFQSYAYIYKGLKDDVDDVVAVSAMCFVPVADQLATFLDEEKMAELLFSLWDALLDLDDLTASTNSILTLLGKLLAHPRMMARTQTRLGDLVPRLYRFLYHSNITTRSETLKTLVIVTDPASKPVSSSPLVSILQSLLVQVYQRSFLETNHENLVHIVQIWQNILVSVSLSDLLVVACPLFSSWICLLMTNPRVAFDPNVLVIPEQKVSERCRKTHLSTDMSQQAEHQAEAKFYLGGGLINASNDDEFLHNVTQARSFAAKLLGRLSAYIVQPMPGIQYDSPDAPVLCYLRVLMAHLVSNSSSQRIVASMVIREWASLPPRATCHECLKSCLLNALNETVYYEQISWAFTRIQQEAKDFLVLMAHYKVPVDEAYSNSTIFTFDQLTSMTGPEIVTTITKSKCRKKVQDLLCKRREDLESTVTKTYKDQIKLHTTVLAVLAGAVIQLRCLPEKLNPVVKPLMESIKKETNVMMQDMAASDLVNLIEQGMERPTNPNGKIVKNLSAFLCVDSTHTPNICEESHPLITKGIWSISYTEEQKRFQRSDSVNRGPGRPKLNNSEPDAPGENAEKRKIDCTQRTGATTALRKICSHFGAELFEKIPPSESLFLDTFLDSRISSPATCTTREDGQKVINWLQLLETTIPVLHPSILDKLVQHIDGISQWCHHIFVAVRYMAGRALSALALRKPMEVMSHAACRMLPLLQLAQPDCVREGTIELVYLCIETMKMEIVPYIVLYMIPLLGTMSDPNETVRLTAMQCFASLVRLYPLGSDCEIPKDLPPELIARIHREKVFLQLLVDPSQIENYKVPVPISVELRSYQQHGVNWLAFLNRYGLHGILCDDMGLGKTLQSICILAGDHFYKEKQMQMDLTNKKQWSCVTGVQSLVVCPPTLTGHWFYEISKFVSSQYLNPLHYTGSPFERKRLREEFYSHNIIVASYKIVRNEIDFFSTRKWNYIILDEGHVIKNVKTKSSKAIKQLIGSHRLILSGTPIQNNVTELWALFDFLMPGFLGSERRFQAQYSRPILQSRDPKSSAKDQEAGVLAMEKLHRQTLPFLLRRMKDQVLNDLPPKITQDYYCDLSPLQEKLYEDFARSQNCSALSLGGDMSDDQAHVFQALQYLRRVCNHPRLVLKPSHPKYNEIMTELKENNSSLSDISQSAKLLALQQLLLDCGIGSCDQPTASEISCSIVSPHRALIFCQFKSMLDIIEQDLLKTHMKTVTYLRLDGSIPAGSRHSLIQRFNSDPSIDLLLLTTHVGGLGLNLTGADTVIFVEHDWNPMRDLQAMDRAHRIGQKKVVNVYRLITKGSLEEKIMNLQKFKLTTANSVISNENESLASMGTDQLLDLFNLDSKSGQQDGNSQKQDSRNGAKSSMKEALSTLPELWQESQYEEEYNMKSFLTTLKK